MTWILLLAMTPPGTPAPSVHVTSQGTDPDHTVAVQRAVTESRMGMAQCYEIALMDDPTLEVDLVAVRAQATWSVRSTSTEATLDECVLRTLDYAIVPAGAATVSVGFRLKVPPIGRVDVVNVAGDAGIAHAITETLPQQRACYARALPHEAVSPGDVRFRLIVYEEGWASVELVQGTLPPDLKACLNDVLQLHRYPRVQASAEVTYHLEMVP